MEKRKYNRDDTLVIWQNDYLLIDATGEDELSGDDLVMGIVSSCGSSYEIPNNAVVIVNYGDEQYATVVNIYLGCLRRKFNIIPVSAADLRTIEEVTEMKINFSSIDDWTTAWSLAAAIPAQVKALENYKSVVKKIHDEKKLLEEYPHVRKLFAAVFRPREAGNLFELPKEKISKTNGMVLLNSTDDGGILKTKANEIHFRVLTSSISKNDYLNSLLVQEHSYLKLPAGGATRLLSVQSVWGNLPIELYITGGFYEIEPHPDPNPQLLTSVIYIPIYKRLREVQ